MALTKIKTQSINDNAITNAKMADDAIDSADLADGSIDNVHLAGSIAVSKTLLAGGTGLTLSTNTLAVDAAQTQITSVGTLTSLATSGVVGITVANVSGVTASTDADDLVIENTVHNGISILTNDNQTSNLYFGQASSNRTARVDYAGDTNIMHVGTTKASGQLQLQSANGTTGITLDASSNTTFAGNIISGGYGSFERDSSYGNVLYLNNTQSGHANSWAFITGGSSNGSGTFTIKNETDSVNALQFDTSSNATFAGNVTVSDRVVGSSDLILVTTDSNEKIHMDSDGYMKFETAGSERMRIISDGKVGIGTTAPDQVLHCKVASGDPYIVCETASGGGAGIKLVGTDTNNKIQSSGGIDFYTGSSTTANGNVRMTIDSSGGVGIGDTSPDAVLDVVSGTNGYVQILQNTHGSSPYGLAINHDHDADNNTRKFLNCDGGGTNRCIIWSDGDVNNSDNGYGSISDVRIKQGIRDANSQWDDIKAIKVRNFKKNEDVIQYKDKAWEQIGVIAQELEESGMDKLVREHPADESEIAINEDINEGDMVKSVQYSIIYMKAIKALQEAMAKIETLESKVTALENV
jgi:hypothetical protein